MTTFKVRNKILAAGGVEIPSGATLTNGGNVANSGSTAITGSAFFGTNGTAITNLMYGTATVTCPSAAASSVLANTVTVANLPAGAKIFVTAGSVQQGFVLVSACVTAASTISCSFLNATTADISSSARTTLQYLAIS